DGFGRLRVVRVGAGTGRRAARAGAVVARWRGGGAVTLSRAAILAIAVGDATAARFRDRAQDARWWLLLDYEPWESRGRFVRRMALRWGCTPEEAEPVAGPAWDEAAARRAP